MKKEEKKRKQIAFDLCQADLKKCYPKPKHTINPLYYKQAYKDIKCFMVKNGFEHRQYSVYLSKEKLTRFDVVVLMRSLAREMPWLAACVRQLDVTDVDAKQHGLANLLKSETEKIQNKQVGYELTGGGSFEECRHEPLAKQIGSAEQRRSLQHYREENSLVVEFCL